MLGNNCLILGGLTALMAQTKEDSYRFRVSLWDECLLCPFWVLKYVPLSAKSDAAAISSVSARCGMYLY